MGGAVGERFPYLGITEHGLRGIKLRMAWIGVGPWLMTNGIQLMMAMVRAGIAVAKQHGHMMSSFRTTLLSNEFLASYLFVQDFGTF